MGSFFLSQLTVYLFAACRGGEGARIAFALFWIWGAWQRPWPALLGLLWQFHALGVGLTLPITLNASLRCDERFWFICTSNVPNEFVMYVSETPIGLMAFAMRHWVENRLESWDPFWGDFAFGLIMGGHPDERLIFLYKNLGFLHVLVISGSQFSLLARWLKSLLRFPATLLYTLCGIDWRCFRHVLFLSDFLSILGLMAYLLASGASPPCQRAFLQQGLQFYETWWRPPRHDQTKGGRGLQLFRLQMLFFPEAWFSLSNVLSWGAVLALRSFKRSSRLLAQWKTSIGIQLMSLAFFSRMSLSALLLDFFVAPLWDLLLGLCLIPLFVSEQHVLRLLAFGLTSFHQGLNVIELWLVARFGASSLVFSAEAAWWGRLTAAVAFVLAVLSQPRLQRDRP